ncbi:MAG: hypothetical protein KatS3mg095_0636 [Candidatus Parcubacteria bacterium]|nr:MAG: hypothetical protein KatS3mg095_0636 [Candidatus Parcubacteria bacterium]
MEEKPTILIIDDSDEFREILKIKLTLEKFEIIEAKNGNEALELLKTQKPDIILLDLLMPGMSGIDVYLAIKSNPEIKDLKIIFLTSMDIIDDEITKNNQQISEELLKVPYINKTKSLDEIVEKIRQEINTN